MLYTDTLLFCGVTWGLLSLRSPPVQKLLSPIIDRVPKKSRQRCSEQLICLCYFSLSTLAGIYLCSEYRVWQLEIPELLERQLNPQVGLDLKYFYLIQMAYWVSEVLVLILGLEKARPDRQQLICHHAVTISLIGASYVFNLTDFGLMVVVPHDGSDALLSVAKLSNYFDSSLSMQAWIMFTLSWIYGRHYLMIKAFLTALQYYHEAQSLNLSTLIRGTQVLCLACLAILQALNVYWLFCILRGIKRAITAREGARDLRSDDEEEEESKPEPKEGKEASNEKKEPLH